MNTLEGRERKVFWVASTSPVAVTQEECLRYTNNPDQWYCPARGFTSRVGGSLFEEREPAVRHVQRATLNVLHNAQAAHEAAMKL